MFRSRMARFTLLISALVIVVTVALSDVALAKQGRGRGRFIDRKSGKFINGHDARDGRFDGRGPRRRFDDRRRFRFDDRGPRRRFDDRYRFHRIPRRRYR